MTELAPEEAATVERFERAPDALVEDLRDSLAEQIRKADPEPFGDWGTWDDEAYYRKFADALLPLIVQREAAARADERERIARAISKVVSYGFEMRPDGSEDPTAAVYVEGLRDAARIARGDA